MPTYLGLYPICLLALGTRDKLDTPQMDMIQIELVDILIHSCYIL